MVGLVVLILFGILIAFFATQNTTPVDVTIANYRIFAVPVYIIALAGLLAGVIASAIMSAFGTMSSFMSMRGKDTRIHHLHKDVTDRDKKIHDLEIENAKLRGERHADHPRLGLINNTKPAA